jgi:predicted DNA-binding helix-hairpin-helix protein
MAAIVTKPDTHAKLDILSRDGQYDLACACSGKNPDEHRRQDKDGKWVYPVTLPNGGTSVLFKTLLSNACSNDCKYCPLRNDTNVRRCTLTPEETTTTFLDYLNRHKVHGLFLSSGVIGTPDNTMEQMLSVVRMLRRVHAFRGYIHLKIIPGASDAAIEEAVSLSSAVSLNIETPGEKNLSQLSDRKHYIKDIIEPMKLISRLTARGTRYHHVKQTTQFIVGAANESDAEIVKYTSALYERMQLQRVYFSAYQRGLGHASLPAEQASPANPADILTREHRLYQVDFLFRKYRFSESDITFDQNGRLSLERDPKQLWAENHPEFFPVNVNSASKYDLLRVPGMGPTTVNRIVMFRKSGHLRRVEDFATPNRLIAKAAQYLKFS